MEIKFLQQPHVSGIDRPKQRIGFCNIWVIMCFLNGVNFHAVPRQLSMLAMPLAHMAQSMLHSGLLYTIQL